MKRKGSKKISNEQSFNKNVIILLSPYRGKLIFVFMCMIIGSILTAVMPLINRMLIDQGIVALNSTLLFTMLGVSTLLFMIERLVDILEFWQLMKLNRSFVFGLTLKAGNHLMKLPISYFKEKQETEVISNLQVDIEKISLITSNFMLIVTMQVFNILGAAIGLMIIDFWLLLIIVIIMPIKFFIVRFYARRHEKIIEKFIKLYETYNALYGDVVKNVEVLKLWNLRRRKLRKLALAQKDILDTEIRSSVNEKISDTLDAAVNFIMNIIIYIIGFVGIMNGRLTIGGVIAFIAYSTQIVSPVSVLAQVQHYIADIKPSLKRHIEFLELPEEEDGVANKIEKIKIPEEISFSNVLLDYDGKIAIDRLNLRLVRGEKVAIIGDNGSGKSSLVRLLLRLETPKDGDIYFDHTKIENYKIDNYRAIFAVINQDISLFNGSVRENIDPRGDSTDAKIIAEFNLWGLEELINTLPEGLNTAVGQVGSKLSGGEKQKIATIRAGIKEAKILILDEATANYDEESERLFNKVLESNLEYDYVIIITHQKDILAKVDRVIRFDKGHVVEDI